MSAFTDTSLDCAICLEPLEGTGKVLTLKCGHKWHLNCLRQQLETAKPSSTKRLLFSGCQCAKCGSICEHCDLEDLTRTTDELREKVNVLIREQLDTEKGSNDDDDLISAWQQAQGNGDEHTQEQVLKEARRKYAFYLCSHCKEPYFGGTVDCADFEPTEGETRLCVGCAPSTQLSCRNPLEHRGSLLWKCRYCCQPATHVCYGTVHFCSSCHDKNGERVHQLARNRGSTDGAKPPDLIAIPCQGDDCPFPKANDQPEHSNGSSLDCEQVYGCVICNSSSQQHNDDRVPGSDNLLVNPSGQDGFRGWRQLNRRMSWQIEESEILVNASTTTNFVSSFQTCAMCQTLNLSSICADLSGSFDPHSFRIQVTSRYMGRTDCPSVFRMEAMLMKDLNDQPPQRRLTTPTLDAPPDYWETASFIFDNVSLEDANYLNIIILGQDRRFWQGNFGSKVADCSVRVLWDPAAENTETR